MCDSLSLGANYLQIYKKLIGFTNKIDSSSFKEILNSIINLKKKVESLIYQFNLCENLIVNIKYIGQKRELFKQNKEKIKFLIDLKQNLEENINFIQINTMKKKRINANSITLRLHEIKFEKEDIKKYFQDFGFFSLFNLELGESCNIF